MYPTFDVMKKIKEILMENAVSLLIQFSVPNMQMIQNALQIVGDRYFINLSILLCNITAVCPKE